MRILSGSGQDSLGLVYGGLARTTTCGALRLHLDILQLTGGTQNYGDTDGIDTYPGVSGATFTLGSGADARSLPSSPDLI